MRSKIKRTTMKDIADVCGYSVNTVSRALRNDTLLPQETINKIQSVASELGYIRNAAASSLRSQSSNLIAAIIDDIQNPYYSEMLSQIALKLRPYGYQLLILCSQMEGMHDDSVLSLALSYNIGGLFLFPRTENRHMIDIINRNHIPLIFLGRDLPDTANDVVRCDDHQGGYLAAKRLIDEGHRHFLFVSGPWNSTSQTLRYNGFMQALSDFNISVGSLREVSFRNLQKAVHANALRELLLPADYTAVCSFSDQIAYAVMNALIQEGFRIPEDISIVGFDYLRQNMPHLPPLSSVSYQPDKSMADTAIELLLARIENMQSEPQSRILPVSLFEEGTIGPARIL